MAQISFYCLNVIEAYNYNMNNVDIVDQLRGSYRFDHWMRKQKWWWSIFFWCFQILLTNSYIVYTKYMITHKQIILSHYEFNKAIALAWLDKDKYWPKNTNGDNDRDNSRRSRSISVAMGSTSRSSAPSSTRRSISMAESSRTTTKKIPRIKDKSIAPNGALGMRLNHGRYWTKSPTKKEPRCQLYYWATNEKYRAQLMTCMECNVKFCINFFAMFHKIEDLAVDKEELAKKYQQRG